MNKINFQSKEAEIKFKLRSAIYDLTDLLDKQSFREHDFEIINDIRKDLKKLNKKFNKK